MNGDVDDLNQLSDTGLTEGLTIYAEIVAKVQ